MGGEFCGILGRGVGDPGGLGVFDRLQIGLAGIGRGGGASGEQRGQRRAEQEQSVTFIDDPPFGSVEFYTRRRLFGTHAAGDDLGL